MARWTHAVIALLGLLGMTGLALAQSPPPPYSAQPPPQPPYSPQPPPPDPAQPSQPYPAQPSQPYPAQPPPPYSSQPPQPYPAQPPPPYSSQPPPSYPPPASPAGPAPAPRSKLGGDLAFVLPLGDYSEGITSALGMFGRFERAMGPRSFATIRLGYLYHLIDSEPSLGVDVSFVMFPIFVGARYNFAPTGDGLFLISEGGFNILWSSVSAPDLGIEDSSTRARFALNLGAGYQAGTISAKGTLFVTTNAGEDTDGSSRSLVGLMVTLGLDFGTL